MNLFTLITSSKALTANIVSSEVVVVRTVTYDFWEDTSQPMTGAIS